MLGFEEYDMSISFSMGMLNWVSWSQPVNPEPLESNSVELFCSRKVYKNAAIFIIPYYIIYNVLYTQLWTISSFFRVSLQDMRNSC